jgi:chaperonin GroES
MSAPIKPRANLVVAVRAEASNKTASGIFIPDSAKEKPVVAVIKAIGENVSDLKVGDKIVYKQFSSNEFKIDGVDYVIVKDEDILGTV